MGKMTIETNYKIFLLEEGLEDKPHTKEAFYKIFGKAMITLKNVAESKMSNEEKTSQLNGLGEEYKQFINNQ